jgi:hypothetical protein
MDAIQNCGKSRAQGKEKRHAAVAIWEVRKETKKAGNLEGLNCLPLPALLSYRFLLS